VTKVQDSEFPDHLFYDVGNQIWYELLDDASIRVGFTPLAMSLAGEVLVFTPKRIGRPFQKGRSFATIECGKWIGAARAAFDGVVLAHNDGLVQRPELMNRDAFGIGWMLIVRPAQGDWSADLITGAAIGPAFATWIASEAYKDRSS
jgi:glycine cleavage system H protein